MRGFFSSIIVVILLIILIIFAGIELRTENKINSIENELIILEQASKERTIMENNVDRIIKTKLEEQIKEENYNLVLIQTQINSALLNYLKNRAKATNIFFENEFPLTLNYLILNSSSFLLQVKGKTFAEYTYTSLSTMNTIVSSKLGKNSILYFTIPIGYTIKVVV